MKPTHETYAELVKAYDYFNAELFEGTLTPCIITMQRNKKAYGFFWGNTWKDAAGLHLTDEIALNPDQFQMRSTAEILSTLVHEMCHLWQHHFGKPSRSGYHNKEWADMMETVGLIPSSTGAKGGKRIGQQVSHYIAIGGRFDKVCTGLTTKGFAIPWLALTSQNEETRKKKAASKTKYTCPECEANAWGKLGLKLVCGECDQIMQGEEPEEESDDEPV